MRRTYNAVKSLLAMIGLAAGARRAHAQFSAKAFAENARLDALRQKAKKQQSA